MDSLVGAAVPRLEAAMRFREARQGVLAANIANVDTPGYRRADLHFRDALSRAAVGLVRSHPRHLPHAASDDQRYRVQVGPRGTRPDGNGVDMDREIIEISRNAGAFTEQAEVLARFFAMARMAVTGDPR
ncbi:MAG: flagellar basal body rod protein FlgB [Myxococcota bacterium]